MLLVNVQIHPMKVLVATVFNLLLPRDLDRFLNEYMPENG